MISMKKRYVKPGIIIEDFKIAQSISAGCGAAHNGEFGGPTQWSNKTCGWSIQEGIVMWIDSDHGCTIPTGETAEGTGVCYNAPEGANIFGSY